jgi:hypothetical protein
MPAFGRVSSKIELTVVSSKRLNPVVKVGKSKRLTRHEAYLKPDQKKKHVSSWLPHMYTGFTMHTLMWSGRPWETHDWFGIEAIPV